MQAELAQWIGSKERRPELLPPVVIAPITGRAALLWRPVLTCVTLAY